MPLGRSRQSQDPARLRGGSPAPPRAIRPALASGHPRRALPLPPRPLGRAAHARVRPQVHDGAAAPGTPRDPRAPRRGPAGQTARRRVRPLAARPRLSDRDPRCAGGRAVSARRGSEPRDAPGAAHPGERRALTHGPGGPPRVHRRYRAVERAGSLGRGRRSAARRVLSPQRDGDGHASHTGAGGRPGPGGRRSPPRLDALLSAG